MATNNRFKPIQRGIDYGQIYLVGHKEAGRSSGLYLRCFFRDLIYMHQPSNNSAPMQNSAGVQHGIGPDPGIVTKQRSKFYSIRYQRLILQ